MMETQRVLCSVGLVLCLLFHTGAAKTVKDAARNEVLEDRHTVMSLYAQQTLFDEKGEEGLTKMTGSPVPLYREDLPDSYIAYWEAQYDTDYLIVNAGPQTGDYDILVSGDLPAQTQQIRDDARARGASCFRFYVLTSTGSMSCTDESGKVVGTNLPDQAFYSGINATTPIDSTTIDNYIRSKSDEQAMIWQSHAERIIEKLMGKEDDDDSDEYDDDESDESDDDESDESDDDDDESVRKRTRLPADSDETADASSSQQDGKVLDRELPRRNGQREDYAASIITPGTPVSIVIGSRDMVTSVRLRYVNSDPDTDRPLIRQNTRLCDVTKGCESANEQYAQMSPDLTQDHATYFNLELDVGTKKAFKGEEFVFAVDIVRETNDEEDVTTRYFAVEYQTRRAKRSTSYSSWSYWSIPLEYKFPDYNQFEHGNCAVGCGPVAWAMVFGYYDRRAGSGGSYSGSMNLYRSGSDGTSGSPYTVAPATNDPRMKNYLKKLNDILGTFCIVGNGATLAGRMDRVESFFRARQTTGSPDVIDKSSWLTWAAIYNDDVEKWAKAQLQQGRPVILGWRAGSYLKWHYPVATKVKSRTKHTRGWWGRRITTTENMVYMHMGWGGYRNDWYNLQAYYAITAKY